MRIHILGIGGTFMSGIAILAKQAGHEVTGSDANLYPPVSTQLAEQGIAIREGYDPAHIGQVDCVIVGNVIRRGNPAIEHVLANRMAYCSGPEWLARNVIATRWVLAVAGTHGKTTTTSLLAWILECAGLSPGYLIGGVPENFGISARLGQSPYFVIEADEYDSAFFDKRSKFLHYHPQTLILNNLEFDHADIFVDLAAIQQQFHHLIKTVPGNGLIISHASDANLQATLAKGCWTTITTFCLQMGDWQAELLKADGSIFTVLHQGKPVGEVHWSLLGNHNVTNALAAIAAAHHVEVAPAEAIAALQSFRNVKRRMEIKGRANEIVIYDDFAHHPTAIAATLAGLRANIGREKRIVAVLEFASYTMRSGLHYDQMKEALQEADFVVFKNSKDNWGLGGLLSWFSQPSLLYDTVDELVTGLVPQLHPGDHVIVMSNSGFGGVHQKLLAAIERAV